ncbi:hypothetical protein [Caudoviricetes sp.]|nr:hypothetical protein [Caudoviricetes sp.]
MKAFKYGLFSLVAAFMLVSGLVLAGNFEDLFPKTYILPNIQNYATASLPTAGVPGRVAFDSTVGTLVADNGSAWRESARVLRSSATVDFASTAATVCSANAQITVTGAAVNDTVLVGPPATVAQGSMFQGYVSAADTVQIKHCNMSAGAIDPASATYAVAVFKS